MQAESVAELEGEFGLLRPSNCRKNLEIDFNRAFMQEIAKLYVS